jgi:hypothetical protein
LNVLSNFLGYRTFSNFCTDFSLLVHRELHREFSFGSHAFSFQALELAIDQSDWNNVKMLLEKYEPNEYKTDFVMYLGNSVRNHTNRHEFLLALNEIENGRHLFYETFVDEDDPDGYYSTALRNYYNSVQKEEGDYIFKSCFLITKSIYENKEFDAFEMNRVADLQVDYIKLHFHQVSRLLELRILRAGMKINATIETNKLVDEMLATIFYFSVYESSWILARCIKSLAFCQLLDFAFQRSDFKNAVFNAYAETKGRISSIADLILQFTCHVYRNPDEFLLTPLRIEEQHFNETKSRMAIESATALLYAKEPVKNVLLKNLSTFTNQTGNTWVMEMLKKSAI